MDFFELNLAKKLAESKGGGGGSSYTPLIEITVINNSSTEANFYTGTYIRDNKCYKESPIITPGETKVLTALGIIEDYDGLLEASVELIYSHNNVTATNLVNCTTGEGNEFAIVTDYNSNASLTLTVEDDGGAEPIEPIEPIVT